MRRNRGCVRCWRARRRSWDSATGFTRKWTRVLPSSRNGRSSSPRPPATSFSTGFPSGSSTSCCTKKSSFPTSISTAPPPTTSAASRPRCLPRSSFLPGSPAGRPTSSSSAPPTGSSGRSPHTPGRSRWRTCRSKSGGKPAMTSQADLNVRPAPDPEMTAIADYLCDYRITSEEAYDTARYSLMDSMGCAMLALRFPECARLLGPVVPGTAVPLGARVPGTLFELDPVKAAFDIGTLIRWLDFNDTWLAAEWGHPSDNLGGILAVADFVGRRRLAEGKTPLVMREVLTAMIKAHEIQGVMALENSFNRVGLDHVVLVKVATTAVV